MPARHPPAARANAREDWRRAFAHPIYLLDGTSIKTLKDAADWIIDRAPNTQNNEYQRAIERLMEAAKGGTMAAARRLASGESDVPEGLSKLLRLMIKLKMTAADVEEAIAKVKL